MNRVPRLSPEAFSIKHTLGTHIFNGFICILDACLADSLLESTKGPLRLDSEGLIYGYKGIVARNKFML